jgi:hypothetical protein
LEKNFRAWQAGGTRRLSLERYELLAVRQPQAAGGSTMGRQAEAFTLETWLFEQEDGSRHEEESFNHYTLLRAETGWQIEQVNFFTRG